MIAMTPPMGWNSWNTFGEAVNEQVIKDTADKIVELGLKDAGYEYVVIDDCWSLRQRGEDGRIVADPKKFPSGMKALADYVHSKGLKFGMYSCAGTRTCAGYPGSFDHEFVDAQTFADWGVDFLKYDYCYMPTQAYSHGPLLYNRMSMALKASGREILFSACNWGSQDVEKWIRSTGAHMYRSTGDVNDSFRSFRDIAMSQVKPWNEIAKNGEAPSAGTYSRLAFSGPFCFNDIDMLICGMHGKGNVANGGCTDVEYKTHFALWCLYQSPLMIGVDLSKVNQYNIDLLKNKELISIDQDPECRPPLMFGGNDRPMYFKHLANNEYILAFFNFTEQDRYSEIEFYDLGITVGSGYGITGYEIFSGESIGTKKENFGAVVPTHDCKMYRIKLTK